MGASFPLISFLALFEPSREGQTVGTVYFFNIMGNVLGGILTGFLLLPHLGTEITLLAFASVNILMVLFSSTFAGKTLLVSRRLTAVSALFGAAALFFPRWGQLYETIHTPPGKEFRTYLEEGVDGIIMTYQNQGRVVNYINGLEHGTRPDPKYYFETLEALSFAAKLEEVLIIGYGAGSITELVLKTKDVRKITLVELNSALITNLKKMSVFSEMLSDSRLDLIIEDGRRFLLRTTDKYDLILMDPLRTTTAYANNLHSREFFELANQHLNYGGVLLVGGMNESRVLPKTVASAFDYVRMYDYFCLASNAPFKRNGGRDRNLLAHFSQDMLEAIFKNHELYLGDETYVKAITHNYPMNQEWKPVSEYYLGLVVKRRLFRLEPS
jgi:predicted membrane-bound spermidine synthase